MGKEIEIQIKFERSGAIFMLFVCAISLLAIAGWIFNQPILASLSPEYIPMAPATALIFLGVCGSWFMLRVSPARHWIRMLVQAGLAGMLIIVLILALNYMTRLGPDLEQLLYPDPALLGNIITARMSPLTALGFFLAIPASLLLTMRQPGKPLRTATAGLSLVVFILSGLNIFGYLYGVPFFYGGTLIPVAITTALSFLFLSLGLLMIAGPACWPVSMYVGASLKARLLRAFIPASIFIVMLQGLLNTVSAPWIVNPALRVAVAAFVAILSVVSIVSQLARKLSSDIEHSDQTRMKAESTLKQSEARFRILAETANDAIINIDHNGHIVFWNRAAETIFGYSADEMIGKPLYTVMPEKFHTSHQEGLQRVVFTGQTHIIGTTVEVVGLRKDGHEFPMALSLASWQAASDVFFTGIARDITGSKRAEEALMESSARFRTLFEASPESILLIDPHDRWHILDCNATACQMNGYTRDELVGQSIDVLNLVPGNPTERTEYLERIRQSSVMRLETLHRRKDGTVFPVEVSTSLITLGGNEVVLGIDRDITQRIKAEQTLHESESRFRAIFEQAAIGVAQINSKTGEFVRVNQKYCEIFGFSREDLLRMRFQEISHPDDLPGDVEQMQKLLAGEVLSFTIEKRHYRSDNSIVWLNVTVSPMWTPGEEPDYHIAVIEDITERKRFELIRNAIFRITQAAMTGEGIDALYKSIHSILGELIPADNFYIALYDSVLGLISFPYYIDQFDEQPPAPTPLQGLTGYVIRSGIPLLAPPEVFDQLVRQGEVEVVGTKGEDWMGAPLKVEERTIGVMVVQSYSDVIHFNQEDLNLLEFVSTQVAQAIERKRLEEEIRNLSLTDELTGLYNRRGFTLLAEQEMKLAQRFKRNVLLFFGDVDGLKTINDKLGHAQGDLALKDVASILRENFRAADIPARFGGDEFVVLAPDSSMENAHILTNRLQVALDKRNQQSDRPYQLAISMGFARYDPEAPCTVSELIAQADDLMYQQKQARKEKK